MAGAESEPAGGRRGAEGRIRKMRGDVVHHGAQVQFATVGTGLAMTHNDFVVI